MKTFIFKEKINIINNGIDIDKFPTMNRKIKNKKIKNKSKNKFIWSSCSYRGLYFIKFMGKIIRKDSGSTLDICSYDTFPKNDNDKNVKCIDKHPFTHHGKLDTKQLYDLIVIRYWLYKYLSRNKF